MVIQRDIIQEFANWKASADRSPLIVQGARQIGKSWAIEEFGKRYYEHVAVFNFDKNVELKRVFKQSKDVRRILGDLELYTTVPIKPDTTLLFFDEIQDCKEALGALKYFKEDAPQYHVIAAGSLLGVATQRRRKEGEDVEQESTFPVGKVTFINMFPVTFKEYLRMADPVLNQHLEQRVTSLEPLPEILFSRLSEQYRRYQVCGGLPRPASDMLDGMGMAVVEKDLEDIKLAYEFDFTKHVNAPDIPKIREIWRSIPSQLSRENKKFVFRVVREGARAREYEAALDWLVLSGMIYRVYCTEMPILPLKHYENTTAFKLYVLDQALLRSMSDLPPEAVLAKGDILREFKGAMAENYILCSLLAQGFKMPHYWTLQGNKAEVDFLIQEGLNILPIEVKAEENVNGKSFTEYNKRYEPQLRIRFSMKNIKRNGNLLNLPLFVCDWLKDLLAGIEARRAD